MFELFTADARGAIMDAQLEARALRHDHVGTEHILLGLLHLPEGIGPRVFEVAVRESMQLGHRDIGAEHLLLAVAASDGLSAEILRSLGADPSMVRAGVLEELGLAA